MSYYSVLSQPKIRGAKWYEEASARLQAYDKGLEKAQSIESALAEIKTKYGY